MDIADDYESIAYKYTYLWEQISERFADYGDYLIFESMNEIGFDGLWNRWGGNRGKAEAFELFNSINRVFVETVRASGGHNPKRHLLIAGYWTDIRDSAHELFVMPDDPAGRLMVSLHYYTPSTFAILTEDASWGKARLEWGDEADLQELNDLMDLAKSYFCDNGYPVIFGEYGANYRNKTHAQWLNYMTTVGEAIFVRGMCPMMWDTPGDIIYDRQNARMWNPIVEQAFRNIGMLER
jgi:endoglucanase